MPESEFEVNHRSIGQHPITGENIHIRSRYFRSRLHSHYIIIEDSPRKYSTIPLPISFKVDGITPDIVQKLESLKLSPRYIGRHPVTGYRIETKLDSRKAHAYIVRKDSG